MKRLLGCCAVATALLAACGPADQLDACEITRPDCQEDVYFAAVRLRGDGFDPFAGVPPIETLTADEYRARLEARASPPSEPDSDDDEEPQEPPIDPWDRALQLLGLLTTTTTPRQASIDDRVINIAAFYSSSTERVTVIDDGRPQDGIGDTSTLLHELIHAFQAGDIGLGGSNSTDSSFARRALVEGEATLYELLAVAEMQRRTVTPERWNAIYGDRLARQRRGLADQASPYFTVSRWFVYPLGGDLMSRQWLRGGNAAVRAVWRDPPRESVALMHQALSAPTSRRRPLDCDIGAPADGFRGVGLDRFGAIQLYAFLVAQEVEDDDAWELSLRWRDDNIFVYVDEDAREVAVSWRVRLERERDAERARDALGDAPGLSVEALDGDLRINAADDEALLDDWPGAECP